MMFYRMKMYEINEVKYILETLNFEFKILIRYDLYRISKIIVRVYHTLDI